MTSRFKSHSVCGRSCVTWLLLTLAMPFIAFADEQAEEGGFFDSLGEDIRADFRYHYSRGPLLQVTAGFAVGGVLANTDADQNIQDFFNDDLSGSTGDNLSDFFTGVGDLAQPLYSFPIYLGAMWLGDYSQDSESAVARWGAASMRAGLIGAPEVLVLSNVAGGNRPEEGEPGWSPFDGDDGVSGHAFFGAVPFITAANQTDRRWLKYTLLVTSTLPGLARVYDDQHYFSQSLIGWWIAYVSAKSVNHTDIGRRQSISVSPVSYSDGAGLQVAFTF